MNHMLLTKYFTMSQYLFVAVVSFNGGKLPLDFWLPKDTTSLTVLRSLLDNLLSYIETIKVDKIEFHAPWINTGGTVKYNNIELET